MQGVGNKKRNQFASLGEHEVIALLSNGTVAFPLSGTTWFSLLRKQY